jgi:hypothetical protein
LVVSGNLLHFMTIAANHAIGEGKSNALRDRREQVAT